MIYFNEIDRFAADWLGNLFPGAVIDTRSIKDVKAGDVVGYERCHFFGGIGGWEYALRLAGWPEDEPVWTGSCPCQPFSLAGQGKAQGDERHLWPEMFRLIRECRPYTVFGEQVSSAIGHGWLDGVFADLEAEGYSCGAIVLGAHGVGSPHIRQRLFWVGHAAKPRQQECYIPEPSIPKPCENVADVWIRVVFSSECDEDGNCPHCGIDYSECGCPGPTQDGYEYAERDGVMYARRLGDSALKSCERDTGRLLETETGVSGAREFDGSHFVGPEYAGAGLDSGRMGIAFQSRLEGLSGDGDGGHESERLSSQESRSASEAGSTGFWSDFRIIPCTDGKARRIGRSVFPLVDGVPRDLGRGQPELGKLARGARGNRVGRLKGYGNAIVPQVAAEFIKAFMETRSSR